MALKKLDTLGPEPVTLEAIKAYLRIEHDEEDDLLQSLIMAARSGVEAFTGRSLVKQKWLFTMNAGYAVSRSDHAYLSGHKTRGDQGIELPRSPFQKFAIDPVLETEYGEKNLTDFRLDTAGRACRVHFGPSAYKIMHGTGTIKIQFIAGYEEGHVPEGIIQAIKLVVADLYERRAAANDNPVFYEEYSDRILTLIKPYQVMRLG
jgi:Phage gp6-like head-tail connector protein